MQSEWKKYRLGELYEVHNGLSKGRKFFGRGYPFLSFSTVFNRYFLPEKLTDLVESTEKERETLSIHRGDVFITRTSETYDELGMSCVALKDYPNATFNGFTKRLRPIEEGRVLPEYIGYFLRSPQFRKKFEQIANVTTRASLSNGDLLNLEVSLPPLPIQRKIASILSALDDKIETNNAICRNLEELLLAVYRNVKYVNECVVKELHDLAEFSKNKKQISELNCQSYFSTENMLPGKAGAVAAESLPTMPKATACNPGDILVSNIRPYFKKIVYCSTNCGCSSDVLCFHPKEDIYSTWLFCSLYEDDFFDYVAAGSKGTKMPRGDKAHIMRYGIDVPPRKKLEEFKSMGNLVLTQINNLRSENRHLSQLRDSILPKLMNGELDVDKIEL